MAPYPQSLTFPTNKPTNRPTDQPTNQPKWKHNARSSQSLKVVSVQVVFKAPKKTSPQQVGAMIFPKGGSEDEVSKVGRCSAKLVVASLFSHDSWVPSSALRIGIPCFSDIPKLFFFSMGPAMAPWCLLCHGMDLCAISHWRLPLT